MRRQRGQRMWLELVGLRDKQGFIERGWGPTFPVRASAASDAGSETSGHSGPGFCLPSEDEKAEGSG